MFIPKNQKEICNNVYQYLTHYKIVSIDWIKNLRTLEIFIYQKNGQKMFSSK